MAATTPVVLISGGVGLTPLVSMLKAVLRDTDREVVFVHGARNGRVHAMKERLQASADTNRRLTSIVFYEMPLDTDIAGYDYDHAGRVDLRRVAASVSRPMPTTTSAGRCPSCAPRFSRPRTTPAVSRFV
jgi:nitric oxide dioxygenase